MPNSCTVRLVPGSALIGLGPDWSHAKSRNVAIVALVFISEVLAMGSYPIWSRSVANGDWLPYAIGIAVSSSGST